MPLDAVECYGIYGILSNLIAFYGIYGILCHETPWIAMKCHGIP